MPSMRPRSSVDFPDRWGRPASKILLSGRCSVKRVIREVNAPSLRRFGATGRLSPKARNDSLRRSPRFNRLSAMTAFGVRREEQDAEIRQSGSMSGVWKRSYGRASEAPPDERGGNGYVRPTVTTPHLDPTPRKRLVELPDGQLAGVKLTLRATPGPPPLIHKRQSGNVYSTAVLRAGGCPFG